MERWSTEHEHVAAVEPAAIWQLWQDVASWPAWDASIVSARLDGPFAVGTQGVIEPEGQGELPFHLTAVEPGRGFTDETGFGPVALRFSHRVEAVDGGARIVVGVEVEGPGAAEIGPMVASDLPDSVAALAAAAVRSPA